jgi:2,4-dienoyl-CoA reductase-like NADH-dependent reductase (Old Yellow Enzyme family)/thioredoxin reductase
MSKYLSLFQPITVGRMNLTHRLMVPPHSAGASNFMGNEEQFQKFVQYYVARVKGGNEWVGGGPVFVKNPLPLGFEPTGVGANGPGHFRNPLYPDRVKRMMDAIHEAGGYGTVQMVLQGGKPLSPSQEPSGYADFKIPHAMDRDEIAWMIKEYGESAAIAIAQGVDVIELHANHDDLLQWFLSPKTNKRTDEYGGDEEGRRKFLKDVVDSIRAHQPRNVTLGLRLCIDELLDGGYDVNYCRYLLEKFTQDGTVDYFSLDVGNNWGVPSYIQLGAHPEGHWADMCGEAKKGTHLPVIYVGRVTSPEKAAEIIEKGQADIVGMVRANIADSNFVNKVRRDLAHTIRPCVGLNDCIHRSTVEGLGFGCAGNPLSGRESEGGLKPLVKKKRVLVIGAGPAGMELAGLAAERGHEVTLWEKAPELGGQITLSSKVRMNRNYAKWVRFQEWRLADAGVKVELNKEATPDEVLKFGADAVCVATGARVRKPGIPGENLPHVLTVAQVLNGEKKPGKRVLVLAEDDRPSPLTVAEHIAGHGHEVTVMFPTIAPSQLVGSYSIGSMMAMVDEAGVKVKTMFRAVEIGKGWVKVAHSYSNRTKKLKKIDTVVLATGSYSETTLYDALKGKHPELHILGDAYAPRRWTFATQQALALAQAL